MTQMKGNFQIPDVQNKLDTRQIVINRVGISAVRYPLIVKTLNKNNQAEDKQHSVGTFTLNVDLSAEKKGTHMSRFFELLEAFRGKPLCDQNLNLMLLEMLSKLEAQAGHITINFPYFIAKTAPISKKISLMDYEVTWQIQKKDDKKECFLTVRVPVTSLCPCSKEISEHGAHNQRSHITMRVLISNGETVNIEDLVNVAEEEASCQLWGLLKREDEKYVTEYAYTHPKFVEDLVRDVASRFNKDERIASYEVQVENFESIHNHNAFAMIAHAK